MSDTDTTEARAVPVRVHAALDGWPVDLDLTIAPARLPVALAKLAALGFTPATAAPAAPAQVERPRRPRVEPVYQPDGTACCPVHHKPLSEGRYGLYCSAKARPGDEQNDKGYCALRFEA